MLGVGQRHVCSIPHGSATPLYGTPVADLQRWRPQLELIDMPAGLSLRRWGEHQGHVYFPTTASVSMLHITRGGQSVEVVAVGNEGMVGIPVIMGGGPTAGEAVVRAAGHGFRLRSAWLLSEFQAGGETTQLFLRYAHALMTHTAQSAICNMHHSLVQRLCRRLLGSLDRANGAPLTLTHESLAGMLGVRREGVTCAALKLQRAGLIDYARGRVLVLDRAALEAHSCECYAVVKSEYERLAPRAQDMSSAASGRHLPPTHWGVPRAGATPAMPLPRSAGRRFAYSAEA
jgi:hypothetical protein